MIEHPPGEETQWDWLELPDPPASWGWGKTAHLFVGSLAHSGKWRACWRRRGSAAPGRRAGPGRPAAWAGCTRVWRFDRMATVCDPGTGRVTASFAGVAKHYGVSVAICPPRRGNRKGVVEKVNHTAAQRWWRTLADDVTVEQAQAGLDRFCAASAATPGCGATADGRSSVAAGRQAEPLRAGAGGAVSGDRRRSPHGVAPSVGVLSRQPLLGAPGAGRRPGRGRRHPLGDQFIDIATDRRDRDRPAPPGRRRARGHGPRQRPCHRPGRRRDGHRRHRAPASPQGTHPTGPGGQSRCRQLLRLHAATTPTRILTPSTDSTVIDLSAYERAAQKGTPCNDPHPTHRRPPTAAESPSAAASRYQQLRAHLAELKLHAAAEALPAVLDQATAEGLSLTAALERLLAVEVDATNARRLAGRLRFACLPTPATLDDFDYDAAAGVDRTLIDELGHLPLPGVRHQHPAHRTTRHRQDPPGRRPGPRGRPRRLPHLLHHRRRPRRPLPPRRDRRTLGHHHAVLRRTRPCW